MIVDELAVADAHPLGAKPLERRQYIEKFTELAEGVVESAEQQRFLSTMDRLRDLGAGALGGLNVLADPRLLNKAPVIPPGIFR